MYEHRTRQLLAWPRFLRRAVRHLFWAALILLVSVGFGTLGYHELGRLAWIDAFLNASMILSGMGPVDRMDTPAGKIFASLYALFSGLVFIGMTGIVLLPWVHRLFHWMHLEER